VICGSFHLYIPNLFLENLNVYMQTRRKQKSIISKVLNPYFSHKTIRLFLFNLFRLCMKSIKTHSIRIVELRVTNHLYLISILKSIFQVGCKWIKIAYTNLIKNSFVNKQFFHYQLNNYSFLIHV